MMRNFGECENCDEHLNCVKCPIFNVADVSLFAGYSRNESSDKMDTFDFYDFYLMSSTGKRTSPNAADGLAGVGTISLQHRLQKRS